MESSVLAQRLRLSPGDRADLAMALWESLSDDEREGELALSPEPRAELDRRWADHEKRPDNVIPWSDVRRKLLARVPRTQDFGCPIAPVAWLPKAARDKS